MANTTTPTKPSTRTSSNGHHRRGRVVPADARGRPPQAAAAALVPAARRDAAQRRPDRHAAGARLRGRVRGDLHRADAQGAHPLRRLGLARLLRGGQEPDRVRLSGDRAAVRPLRPLRRARAAPGPAEDRHLAVPGDRGGADLRRRQRRAVLELLHLLRHAVLRDRLRRLDPLGLREGHRHAAAGRGLPPARAAGRLGPPHRGRRARARRRGPRARRDGRLHLADAAPGQRAALARPDRGPRRRARQPARAGGHHRRPRLPAGAGRRARRPVPPARRHGAHRALDDGDPGPPRGVRAGDLGAAVRAAPAGLRRLRLRGQAHVRLPRLARCS